MAGKQDDAAGPTVRHIRSAMLAIDKIVALDAPEEDKRRALYRIEDYAARIGARQDAERAKAGTP